ncbi:hypothetical protein PS623_04480 [Pseudomonas fluorescens]|nr:hypothetical protein PS623_04480 [Pseudomonas fluorescens]
MQVAAQAGEAWVAAVSQLHLDQVEQLGLVLEVLGHVVVEHANATFSFDRPQAFKLRAQFARIKWFLRGQALLLAGQVIAA